MSARHELAESSQELGTLEINSQVQEKFLLQEEFRNAVARQEFVLYYQPQVDLRSGKFLRSKH
jgi:sensor c-di-GMP phosphodiesterase-like protein